MSGRLGPKDSVQHCSVSLAFQLKALACNSSRDDQNVSQRRDILRFTSSPAEVSCSAKPIFQLGFHQPVRHQVVQHYRHHLRCRHQSVMTSKLKSANQSQKIGFVKEISEKELQLPFIEKNLCKSKRWSLPLFLGRWRFLWSSRHMHRLAWVKQELHI